MNSDNLWGEQYCLIQLAKPGRKIEIPGKREKLKAKELQEMNNLLILGSHGFGMNTFFRWFIDYLPTGHHYVWGEGDAWSKDLFLGNNLRTFPTEKHETIIQLLELLDSCELPSEIARALFNLDSLVTDVFYIFINNFQALKQNQEISRGLRIYCDRHPKSKLHFVIGCSSDEIFQDTLDRTGFLAQCHTFRLPFFDKEDLRNYSRQHLKRVIDNGILSYLYQVTGGQPSLVKEMLADQTNEPVTLEWLEKRYSSMIEQQPKEAHFWLSELKSILTSKPFLYPLLKRYITGSSLDPNFEIISSEEIPLYIAGWLGLNQSGQWSITSEWHRHICRKLLSEVKR